MPGRREWDTRVVWNVQHQKWWWNAWHESTSTELWGFAESHEAALGAMTAAMQNQLGGAAMKLFGWGDIAAADPESDEAR
jgi:hypothetical protein